jgi:hypothetical protein
LILGYGLNNKAFQIACRVAAKYGQAHGYGENISHRLLTQLRQFKRNDPPFKLDYDSKSETPLDWWLTFEESEDMPLVSLAIKMFSITPSEAGCERNFSVLKWYYGDRRTRLDLNRIESMSMMRSFWMTNVKKELAFYGKTNTADNLRHCTRTSTVVDEIDEYEFDDDDDTSEDPESPDYAIGSTTLDICVIANLDHTIFNGDQVTQTNLNRVLVQDNMEFNVDDLVLRFFNEN